MLFDVVGYASSSGYVYCFCQMFQGLRLFWSLEYQCHQFNSEPNQLLSFYAHYQLRAEAPPKIHWLIWN